MKKEYIIKFETNLNNNMKISVMSNSHWNAKRIVKRMFPDAIYD